MIIKVTKTDSNRINTKYKFVYLTYKNSVYGHCVNHDYGRLFISLNNILDFNYRMREIRNSNDYKSN